MTDSSLRNPWIEIGNRWKFYGPPGRPHKSEIKIISDEIEKHLIQKKDHHPVNFLILGCTPEYRDMLAILKKKYASKFNINVTLIDIFKEMYEQMSLLTQLPNKDEQFIHGSWLDKNNFQKEYFDLLEDTPSLAMIG